MEVIRTFLESSTIHGLLYISAAEKYVKAFWSIVVMLGFTGAGIMIYQSFQDWNENPIKTKIDTRPITEIIFPKLTVCPPKNTFTDLNYYLKITENMTLDNDTRNDLINFGVELLYDHLYEIIMTNLSKIVDDERYYNWYHGYTNIELPYFDKMDGVNYNMRTRAKSGSISTQFFGKHYDDEKVETYVDYRVWILTPHSVKDNPNVTLHYAIDKVSMSEDDNMIIKTPVTAGDGLISSQITHISKNYTPPGYQLFIELERDIALDNVRRQQLKLMPGFRLRWHYSGGGDGGVLSEASYSRLRITKHYVRNGKHRLIIFKFILL